MLLRGENMDLEDYLYLKKMTQKDFAQMMGYSRNHISGIVSGRIKPNLKLARAIEKFTEGEVKVKDLIKEEKE